MAAVTMFNQNRSNLLFKELDALFIGLYRRGGNHHDQGRHDQSNGA
jgi:hypothetical protein